VLSELTVGRVDAGVNQRLEQLVGRHLAQPSHKTRVGLGVRVRRQVESPGRLGRDFTHDGLIRWAEHPEAASRIADDNREAELFASLRGSTSPQAFAGRGTTDTGKRDQRQ
jgi:hypothetical protein